MRFLKNKAWTHVRLHPINTIKPRKKQSTTPLIPKHIGDITDFFWDISFENEI